MTLNLGQKVKWDAVVSATLYDVDLRNGDGGASVAVRADIAETEITAEALMAGCSPGNYTVRVRAKNATFTGAYSPAPYLAFTYDPLGVPGNIRIE